MCWINRCELGLSGQTGTRGPCRGGAPPRQPSLVLIRHPSFCLQCPLLSLSSQPLSPGSYKKGRVTRPTSHFRSARPAVAVLFSLSLPFSRIFSSQGHQQPGCIQGLLVLVDRGPVIPALSALLTPGFAAAPLATSPMSASPGPSSGPFFLYLHPLSGVPIYSQIST